MFLQNVKSIPLTLFSQWHLYQINSLPVPSHFQKMWLDIILLIISLLSPGSCSSYLSYRISMSPLYTTDILMNTPHTYSRLQARPDIPFHFYSVLGPVCYICVVYLVHTVYLLNDLILIQYIWTGLIVYQKQHIKQLQTVQTKSRLLLRSRSSLALFYTDCSIAGENTACTSSLLLVTY